MTYIFEYSQEFKDLILDYHKGKEDLPSYQINITDHLGGPDSTLSYFINYIYPEIHHHFGDLTSKRVLDFGCGTGSTTAGLAMYCNEVVAFDIDPRGTAVCKARLKEHNMLNRTEVLCAPDFDKVYPGIGKFDFILINAVIEHIPLSKQQLRKKTLLNLLDALNVQGCLCINDAPNRLWPIDFHTTKLWWIPWTKPGSRWAYQRAVRKGRHKENPVTHSEGPLGLEERGAWGTTFFEIQKYFSGKSVGVVNSLPGHNRHLSYTQKRKKRQLFDFLVYYTITKWTKIPITAMAPFINFLIIRKLSKK